MIQAAEIRGTISGLAILERYGIASQRSGGWLRVTECPLCGGGQSMALAIRASDGGWRCHRCCVSGDALALIAALEGVNARDDFARILSIGAELSGHSPCDPIDAAPTVYDPDRARYVWRVSDHRSSAGEQYLRSRGIDLPWDGSIIRFGPDGSPRSPLWGLDPGAGIVNVVTRRIRSSDGSPTAYGLKGCTSRGALGPPHARERRERVVLVEGVTDYWAALTILGRDARVHGAHGAGRLPEVASLAREGERWVLVPDADSVGEKQMRLAAAAVEAAGASVSWRRPQPDLCGWLEARR